MQELRNNTLTIFEPFLSAFNYHTVLKTIIDGSTSGHVYVNDLDSPEIVFFQFRHRAFIMDDLNANNMLDFERFFTDEVFENCRNTDASLVRLTAKPETWLILLESSLKTLIPILFNYQIYQYQLSDSEGKPKIPEGFERAVSYVAITHVPITLEE